eukprot:766092-Hanusia_phi.AAC.4
MAQHMKEMKEREEQLPPRKQTKVSDAGMRRLSQLPSGIVDCSQAHAGKGGGQARGLACLRKRSGPQARLLVLC